MALRTRSRPCTVPSPTSASGRKLRPLRGNPPSSFRFARDSPVEERGFQLSVPLQSRQPHRDASTTLGSIAERTEFPHPIVPKPLRPPISPARRRAPARAGRCLDPDQDDWLTENG